MARARELGDALSDLQALKKLYGLLLNQGSIQGRASFGNLDEKSRILLKKLLDCAAEKALDGKTSTQRNSTFSSIDSPCEKSEEEKKFQTTILQPRRESFSSDFRGEETENRVTHPFCSFDIIETNKAERGLGLQQKKMKTAWSESKQEPAVFSNCSSGGHLKSSMRSPRERTGSPRTREQDKDQSSVPCHHCEKQPDRRGKKPAEEPDNGAKQSERKTSDFHRSPSVERSETTRFNPVCIPSECGKLYTNYERAVMGVSSGNASPTLSKRFHGATPLVRELCLKRSRSRKTDISDLDRTEAQLAMENQKLRGSTSFSRFPGVSTRKTSENRAKAPRSGTEKDTGRTHASSLMKDEVALRCANCFDKRNKEQHGDGTVSDGGQMGKSLHIEQSQAAKESKNRISTNLFSPLPARTVVPRIETDTTSNRLSSRTTKSNRGMEEANRKATKEQANQNANIERSRNKKTGDINSSTPAQILQNRKKKTESGAVMELPLTVPDSCSKCNRPRRAEHSRQKEGRDARLKTAQAGKNTDNPRLLAASKSNSGSKFNIPGTEKKGILIRDEKPPQKQNLQGQKMKRPENPIDARNSVEVCPYGSSHQGRSRQTNRKYEIKCSNAKEDAWTGTSSESLTLQTSGVSDSSLSRQTSSSSWSLHKLPTATTTTWSSRTSGLKKAKNRIVPITPYIGPTFLSRNKTLRARRITTINHKAGERRRRSRGNSSSSSSSRSSPRVFADCRLREAKPANTRKTERPGRLKRLKNKLSVIFHDHHHHHHHHHHGRGSSGIDDDSDSDATPPDDRSHKSFWRYIRKALHRKHDQGKMSAEEHEGDRGARTLRNPECRPEHGYLYSLMESFLRHIMRGPRKRRDMALNNQKSLRKSLRKIGENLPTGKSKKLGRWQNLHRRGGVKLVNRKKPRIALGARRWHEQS